MFQPVMTGWPTVSAKFGRRAFVWSGDCVAGAARVRTNDEVGWFATRKNDVAAGTALPPTGPATAAEMGAWRLMSTPLGTCGPPAQPPWPMSLQQAIPEITGDEPGDAAQASFQRPFLKAAPRGVAFGRPPPTSSRARPMGGEGPCARPPVRKRLVERFVRCTTET